MGRLFFRTAAGLCLAPLLAWGFVRGGELTAGPARAPTVADKDAGTCGNHGTSVHFFDTPSEAARAAKKGQKLVFVLHVSGNFEDPRFT
jgi:hypothetical protein